jgi:hypothetical protein
MISYKLIEDGPIIFWAGYSILPYERLANEETEL